MNNAPAIIRSLIIYAVCVPLAITVGYLLTNPMDYSTLGMFGILGLVPGPSFPGAKFAPGGGAVNNGII
jgi:hypothetical protein